jgi:hypothetical protein
MGLFNFVLRGNTSLEPMKTKKTVSWLSDANWKDLELLQTLDSKYKNLVNEIVENEPLWHAWYDESAPNFPPGRAAWVTGNPHKLAASLSSSRNSTRS